MKLVNRQQELKILDNAYKSKKAEFAVIYGRRRTGKTTLIEKFVENKNHIYFLADESNETLLLKSFAKIITEKFDSALANINFENWEVAFNFLLKLIQNKKEKFIIVIDEFQYIGKTNKAFPSILQKIWDKILKKENIFLIISGSILSMMYSQVLEYKSPLYGRRTVEIKCRPFLFKHCKEFFPNLKNENLIEFYAVTGGIPKYMELFNAKINLIENIKNHILSQGVLYEEPKHLLKDEINEVSNYFSILKAISFGNRKMQNISNYLRLSSSQITPFLEKLIDLQIIKRQTPVTEHNPEKSKKGLYYFEDYFFYFWFTFVFPYRNYLELGKNNFVISKIKNRLNEYVSTIFEDVAIQYIWDKKPFFDPEKVGRWWNKNTEIDLIAINDAKQKILFGECKWSNQKIKLNILNDLKNKINNLHFFQKLVSKKI